MIEFYWSEDQGLLDQKASIFISKYKNPIVLKNPHFEVVVSNFLQYSFKEEHDLFLIWDYEKDDFEKLVDFFSNYKIDPRCLLFLNNSSKEPVLSLKLKKFFNNKTLKIKKLGEKTKSKYIFKKIVENKISISHEVQNYLENHLPPDALEINSFFSTLSLYYTDSTLSLKEIKKILFFSDLNVDNFVFFGKYFIKNIGEWIENFEFYISNRERFISFFSAFCYKLFEFKNFLEFKKDHSSNWEVAKKMDKNIYFLSEYIEIYKKWDDCKDCWFERFILGLSSMIDFCIPDFANKIYLFKYFLIRNNL